MPSKNAQRGAKYIQHKVWHEDTKMEYLEHLFREDPSCVHEIVPLSVSIPPHGSAGTLLHAAAGNGYKRIVRLLLRYGVDVNAKNNLGLPPIFAVCNVLLNENLEILQLLLTHGADVEVCDAQGRTPLFYAVESRHSTRIVKILLEHGAKVTIRCLKWSLIFSNIACAKIFIRHLLLKDPDLEKPPFLTDYSSISTYWDTYKARIVNELDSMKNEKFGDSIISVYDIYIADEKKLAHYVRNSAFKGYSKKYKTLFPLYGHRIDRQYRKGMKRMTFEEQGSIVMDHWQPPLCNSYVREKLFHHLDTQDLKNLRQAGILALENNSKVK